MPDAAVLKKFCPGFDAAWTPVPWARNSVNPASFPRRLSTPVTPTAPSRCAQAKRVDAVADDDLAGLQSFLGETENLIAGHA